MSLQVFKQTTYEGCLPISLLILANVEITREKELEIIYDAIQKYRESYYVYNILDAFVEKYNTSVNLYVDVKFYAQYLKNLNKNKKINVTHNEINESFFIKLNKPFALYVDDFTLGEETHSQHFIVIEELDNHTATIIDPWPGKRKKINKEILMKAVNSLKKQFYYSPLLITID